MSKHKKERTKCLQDMYILTRKYYAVKYFFSKLNFEKILKFKYILQLQEKYYTVKKILFRRCYIVVHLKK